MILFSDLRQSLKSNNGVKLLQIVTSPIRKGGNRKRRGRSTCSNYSATNSERGRKTRQRRGQGRSQQGRGRRGEYTQRRGGRGRGGQTRPYTQTVSLTINSYYYYIITIRVQRQCIAT